jgi:bifunctional enzyme CysN/CysC
VATLEPRAGAETLARHEAGECILRAARPLAFDLDPLTPATSRFVLVDDYEIAGGGIIREALPSGAGRG